MNHVVQVLRHMELKFEDLNFKVVIFRLNFSAWSFLILQFKAGIYDVSDFFKFFI